MKFSIKDIFSKCDQIRSFLSAVLVEFFLAKQISPHIFCDILIYKNVVEICRACVINMKCGVSEVVDRIFLRDILT